MSQFLIIALISYLIGSYFIIRRPHYDLQRLLLDFAKGYLVMLAAGLYLHAGLSFLFAATAVLAGHTKPLFHDFDGDTTEAISLGIIFYMSKPMAAILLLLFLVWHKLLKDYDNAVFATALAVAPLAMAFFQSDSFIIISIIILASVGVEFWPPALEQRLNSGFFVRAAFGMGMLGIILLFFFNKYVYKGFGIQRDIIRHGPHHFNFVALTFDDGPDPDFTPQILDTLKEKNVLATFFLIGKNVEKYPELTRRIIEEGHIIGSHTYSHRSLVPLTAKSTRYEILQSQRAIEEVTGIRPTLFRPPRGVYSAYARQWLKEERYTLVLWDLTAMDWAELAPGRIVANVVKKAKPGSVILLHDSGDLISYKGGDRQSTVKALPKIIDELRDEGYDFVTIQQMIFLTELMETEVAAGEDSNGPSPSPGEGSRYLLPGLP